MNPITIEPIARTATSASTSSSNGIANATIIKNISGFDLVNTTGTIINTPRGIATATIIGTPISTPTGTTSTLPAGIKIASVAGNNNSNLPVGIKIASFTGNPSVLPAGIKIASVTGKSAVLPAGIKIGKTSVLPAGMKIASITGNTAGSPAAIKFGSVTGKNTTSSSANTQFATNPSSSSTNPKFAIITTNIPSSFGHNKITTVTGTTSSSSTNVGSSKTNSSLSTGCTIDLTTDTTTDSPTPADISTTGSTTTSSTTGNTEKAKINYKTKVNSALILTTKRKRKAKFGPTAKKPKRPPTPPKQKRKGTAAGRPARVGYDAIFDVLKYMPIFHETGELRKQKDPVWKEACSLLPEMNLHNLYLFVHQDRRDIRTNLLKYLGIDYTVPNKERYKYKLKKSEPKKERHSDIWDDYDYYDTLDAGAEKDQILNDLDVLIRMKKRQHKDVIHQLSLIPFAVHYWNKEQITLWTDLINIESPVSLIVLDQLVERVTGTFESNNVFLYALAVKAGDAAVLVGQMISDSIESPGLQYFLNCWMMNDAPAPPEIIVPYFYNLLDAASLAFNFCTFDQYNLR